MMRDHLLGFPAVLRQHDEPVVPKEQTVKERPAAFVAFEKGVWKPKMTVGVDPAAEGGDQTTVGDVIDKETAIWDREWGMAWGKVVARREKDALLRRPASGGLPFPGPKKDAEQAAFENWCDKTRPSGDVESVQRQWVESDERAELFEAETREITYDDVLDTIRKLVVELGKPATKDILAEFGVSTGWGLKPEQWAEFIATAERRLAGWVKWSGGKQPVADLQMVEIRFRAWPETKGYAGNLGWWWHREESNRFADIVEYRVVVEAKQADGWIKWSGGEQPVANSTKVEVRYGEGTKDCGPAGNWDWRHHGDASGDIVEYRVIK